MTRWRRGLGLPYLTAGLARRFYVVLLHRGGWRSVSVAVACTAAALAAGAGCRPVPGRGGQAPAGEVQTNKSVRPGDRASGSVFDRPLRRVSVEFKVHRYSAPKGGFSGRGSGGRGIWKLVTGPLPDAATALHLADNGFQAAIGRESDRRPLREFLGGIAGLRSALDYARPDASRHVELDLGPCRQRRQVVFYYGRDGSLRGLDFLEARARLRLAFEMRSVNLKEVWLEVVPELEEPPGPPKWVITEEGAKQVPEERRHTFGDLAFAARIPEGGFLLLGPTDAVHDRPLVARPFFVEQIEDSEDRTLEVRESIYVISPMVRFYSEKERGGLGDAVD